MTTVMTAQHKQLSTSLDVGDEAWLGNNSAWLCKRTQIWSIHESKPQAKRFHPEGGKPVEDHDSFGTLLISRKLCTIPDSFIIRNMEQCSPGSCNSASMPHVDIACMPGGSTNSIVEEHTFLSKNHSFTP